MSSSSSLNHAVTNRSSAANSVPDNVFSWLTSKNIGASKNTKSGVPPGGGGKAVELKNSIGGGAAGSGAGGGLASPLAAEGSSSAQSMQARKTVTTAFATTITNPACSNSNTNMSLSDRHAVPCRSPDDLCSTLGQSDPRGNSKNIMDPLSTSSNCNAVSSALPGGAGGGGNTSLPSATPPAADPFAPGVSGLMGG